jgi:UDP-2,3-diacylglucosamine pyrophosphatase LpxH
MLARKSLQGKTVERPELYIISDLHLCDGSRVEDFRSVDERSLVAFLFRLSRAPRATLIVNGDFIDFVQIQPRPRMWFNATLDASEAESLEKLDRAIAAHSPVFDALGRFVASGHQLRFHFGNHDIDLVWPRVQTRLRERIASRPLHHQISFGDTLITGGALIEHGHQADPANSFPPDVALIQSDPLGVPRLYRCWGTRLVEEFYNRIEVLDGCDMLDNVRPRMQAALIVIKHAIMNRPMHAMLYAGVQVIVDTLAQLETEQDVQHAADQLGVSPGVLGWLVSVAGWLNVGGHSERVAKSADGFASPSLRTAYAYGAQMRDGAQLAALAPPFPDRAALQPKAAGDRLSAARREYDARTAQRFVQRATLLAQQHSVRAVCFGHTHRATTPALAIDDAPGWPLPGTAARYFNGGSWTASLDLQGLSGEQQTFEYLQNPAHYRVGRDYLRITWPDDPDQPVVETLGWN